ncbi:THUMP domain-containing class I SAM-dependent RNA methyltransferase [Alkaliphilus peptidifermentans]|uniref:Putative N6-adenine-specific DNA methylase n=1 Tax=Alkaliphilus peptidifermentans DSM 18978 TaxID=1120976 RepID=A0A1G5KIS4_9FIRM|nr:class I SAM-dependent RNA methyltransferase [Alkaliphilus peptidifermentans]SCY99958.1 putative N6-adenine-specific DNA methylase [Alkaliphilus peptidifermentans DSM 18978]
MDKIQLIATAAFGLEAVVAREVKDLGYEDVAVENGRVTFTADLAGICRCNLWLRTADRVLIKIGEFKATTFEELFQNTKALPWHQWIPEDAEFPVEGKSIRSKLFSVSDCQAIVKKAVVEKMKERYNREWFNESGGKYKIEVALLKDIATLTIDTSGAGLHKRGYRTLSNRAPLKETLAAGLILLSYWNPDRVLIDPLCGSGTIPIEAGLIGKNIAPGMNRNFVSEDWTIIPKNLWWEARKEAHDLAQFDRPLRIYGSDIDGEVLKLARYHIGEAGLEDDIHIQKLGVGELASRFQYGCIITNPPYGERIGELKEVEGLYKEMGKVFKGMETWSKYIITSHPDFQELFGKKADKKRKLYNGRIECTYYQYYGPRPPKE